MAKHPRMLEAIENAKKAAVSTRGLYPYTTAASVFASDGNPIEEDVVEATGNEEVSDEEGTPEEAE